MRITEIEIKNFKAFYGTYRIDLRKSGKNLLVYGENGSGKSSLYFALKLFLESGDDSSIDLKTIRTSLSQMRAISNCVSVLIGGQSR